jgi:beta-phosphoglucomutase-like phosphatase (HAD superfamily)
LHPHVAANEPVMLHEGPLAVQGGLLRETGAEFNTDRIERLQRLHAEAYNRNRSNVRPLPRCASTPGSVDTRTGPVGHCNKWTAGDRRPGTRNARHRPESHASRDPRRSNYAKPEPDLFLTAAHRLGVAREASSVVGDSVWDMLAARRARALGIGLLSGGYGIEELERAGAYRVYEDPADLLEHLDEVGVRR